MRSRQLERILPRSRSQWLLAAVYLLSAWGKGLYAAVGIIYFVRVLGLRPAQVGLAISAAGVCGLLIAVPLGQLADRFGARRAAAWIAVTEALLLALLVAARSFLQAFPLIALIGGLDRAGAAVRQALVSDVMGPESRVRTQAYLRSVLNVGVSLGALAAVPVLTVNSTGVYAPLILAGAGAQLVVAWLILLLDGRGAAAGELAASAGAGLRGLLRDWSFLALGLLNGVLALHITILEVAMPLWVIQHTRAQTWTVPFLLAVNTVLAVAFQVPASRGADTVGGAVAVLRRAAVVAAAACALFVPSAWVAGAALLLPLLVAAVAVLTGAELLQSAGGWGLSFGLAPAGAQGSYLGAFSLGYTVQDLLGPLLVVALVIGGGWWGWLVLAALFLAAGLLLARGGAGRRAAA
jgi:MFS family permease